MAERLVELIRELRVALVAFRPETVSAQDCAVLVEELAATEKASAAARVRAAVRAGEVGVHRERGFADVSDWLAARPVRPKRRSKPRRRWMSSRR